MESKSMQYKSDWKAETHMDNDEILMRLMTRDPANPMGIFWEYIWLLNWVLINDLPYGVWIPPVPPCRN